MDGAGPDKLKLLGAFGMFGESIRVISTRKKLFAQITLAFVLPLCLLFLAHSIISQLALENALKTSDHPRVNYNETEYSAMFGTNDGWAINLGIKVAYFTVVLILSLLAMAAVVYTAACVYASMDVTFKKVLAAVPKVWKRLAVTFFWVFLAYVAFSLVPAGLLACAVLLMIVAQPVGILLAIIVIIPYSVGIFYLAIVMQLASVVSVLEDVYGRRAIRRSRSLLKGKLWSVAGCFLLLFLCFGLVELAFEFLVAVRVVIESMALTVVFGIVLWLVLALHNLVSLVASTVAYFVCKSYHGENTDMFLLADRLKVYHEATKYVQLEQSPV